MDIEIAGMIEKFKIRCVRWSRTCEKGRRNCWCWLRFLGL